MSDLNFNKLLTCFYSRIPFGALNKCKIYMELIAYLLSLFITLDAGMDRQRRVCRSVPVQNLPYR